MVIDIFLKLVFSILLFYGAVTFNFAMFKVPIKRNHIQITIFAVVLGAANYYNGFFVNSPSFPIVNLVLYIILILSFRRYPLLYSFIFCGLAYFVWAVIDGAVSIGAIGMGLTSLEMEKNDLLQYCLFHSITTFIYFLLALILVKFKIGLSMVIKKFSGPHSLKAHNFILSLVLIIGISFMQIGSVNFHVKSYQCFLLVGMVAVMVISLWYAFKVNKKSVNDRYTVFEKDKKGQ